MSDEKNIIPAPERIPYPSHPLLKWAFKAPMVLFRLGLGGLAGRLFLVMTTTGRKSGLPRRTAIEYHEFNGRKYILSAWARSDWYRNLQADPHVTIQTHSGAESVRARRLTEDAELAEAYASLQSSPFMQQWARWMGFELDLESFLENKAHYRLITFDPTDIPTPPPQGADLKWVWGVVGAAGALWLLGRVTGRSRSRGR